jgi:tRNA A-37 threonylcarbamoyl transferase component Bud32
MTGQPRSEPSHKVLGRSSRAVGRVSGSAARWLLSTSSLRATGRFMRSQLWAWPIVAALVFGGAGLWVNYLVEDTMHRQRAHDLNAMVDASSSALRLWMGEQRINAQLFAEDEFLRPHAQELLALARGSPAPQRWLLQARGQEAMRTRLKRKLQLSGYVGYFVVAPDGMVVAADQDAPIGKLVSDYRKEVFAAGSAGKALVSRPFRSTLLLEDAKGELRANLPSMYTVAPLVDESGKPIAALGLRIRPEDQFTRILQVIRFGDSGETFAFDQNGLLLSQSRFDDLLKRIGLLADQPDARSILTVELRDPGVNMVAGERPSLRRQEQPLTRLAAAAVLGQDGHDADGYRGYRGVWRVGAWRWLPEYDFGIATEVDAAEAFASVTILRRALWSLMALLALSALGIFLAMRYIARQQQVLHQVSLAARQLGQYALEEKIGAGGMGTVYKARHAMLRRPTAVKLLDLDKVSDLAVARFEREVQLTSTLTHPNTVAIFDYGRTPDGIFYYAMEYLEGMNLDDLVRRFGPLSEARLVYILSQVCDALAEAHALGLVHRDIKPANIFLTCRGGMHDFVKVLDFGLVKALDSNDTAHLTSPNAIVGTPLYLAPEVVEHQDMVDARSDVYALGAVGYYLLTGTPVFTGKNVMETCMKHVKEPPEPPSVRRGKPVSPALEELLLRCLSKSMAERPADAVALRSALAICRVEGRWTSTDAADWWASYAATEAEAWVHGQSATRMPASPREVTRSH